MIKVNCIECGKSFETKQAYVNRGHGKFCSTKCAAIHGNRNRSSKIRPNVKCASCGKDLHRKAFFLKKFTTFYCNRKCKRDAEYRGFMLTRSYGKEKRKRYAQKTYLMTKFGVKCQVPNCPNDLMNDRRLVDMHHFGEPTDHSKTILLCPYHHRLANLDMLKSLPITSSM